MADVRVTVFRMLSRAHGVRAPSRTWSSGERTASSRGTQALLGSALRAGWWLPGLLWPFLGTTVPWELGTPLGCPHFRFRLHSVAASSAWMVEVKLAL